MPLALALAKGRHERPILPVLKRLSLGRMVEAAGSEAAGNGSAAIIQSGTAAASFANRHILRAHRHHHLFRM